MSTFYNEHDAYPAAWLRNLIDAGHVAPGTVDERSVIDLEPADLAGFTQAHFFAGIGGWAYALRLAGWADDAAVWTGSCPCQPLSVAGKGRGAADERHLWPAWFRLIRECRPRVVFGEQVASPAGRTWLAAVRADLEGAGYAVGAANLCAAGAGAFHIRQRLWFVAYAGRLGGQPDGLDLGTAAVGGSGAPREQRIRPDARAGGADGRLGDAREPGLEGHAGDERGGREPGRLGARSARPVAEAGAPSVTWIPCRDGKARPTEPGIFPLADALPAAVDGAGTVSRVGALRGAGNAIDPELAAVFVRAAMAEREPWPNVELFP